MTVRLTFAAIAGAVLAWTAFVTTRPYDQLLGYMTDDAFYYLLPAYSFARGDGWTFDHLTRTSGFHVLYAYVAALVSLVTGFTRTYPAAMMALSAAAFLVGIWLLLEKGRRLYGATVVAAATALTIAVPRALLQLTAGLEWGFAVMATALFVAALISSPRADRRSIWAAALGAAALLAVLTRIDLAIFVAVYTLAVASSRWYEQEIGLRRAAGICLAAASGAAGGIALTALNSWAAIGSFVSNSVLVKAFWSKTNAFEPALSWNMLVACTGPGAALTHLRSAFDLRTRIVLALFVAAMAVVCWTEWRNGALRRGLAVGSALAIAAYTVAYARGVNLIGDHYSAPIIVPMALLTCGLLAASRRYAPVVAACLAVGVGIVNLSASWQGNAAHRVIARRAPELYAQARTGSRVAGWNVGIAGWRTGGHVTNLDGLANASVVEPIRTGTLACYLASEKIDYVMDFGFMFPGRFDAGFSRDEEARRRLHLSRNGYDSETLFNCTTVAATAADELLPTSTYRLFALDRRCVRTLCSGR
jgi:hypothetical protein